MKQEIAETIKALRGEDETSFLCVLPFFHLYNDAEGNWGLCCKAEPFDYSVNEVNSSTHLSTELMHTIREEMVTGNLKETRKYCWKCLEGEKKGLKSFRQSWNEFVLGRMTPGENPLIETIAEYGNRSEEDPYPPRRILDAKLRIFGNQCNLSCYMCSPSNSSTRIQEVKKIRGGYWFEHLGDHASPRVFESQGKYEEFVNDIVDLLPYIRSIRIIGGEPFLLKNHFTFLDTVIDSGNSEGIILTYHTNLTLFSGSRERLGGYFDKFSQIYLYVSLDGVWDKNDYIRHGSNFKGILDNIRYFLDIPQVEIQIYSTISMLNAGEVVDIIEFYESEELNLQVSFNMVTGPDFLRAQHLPDELKAIYLKRIEDSPYADRCQDVVRMLNQERDEALFLKFMEYTYDLDHHRKKNLLDHWPEFKPWYRSEDRVTSSETSPLSNL